MNVTPWRARWIGRLATPVLRAVGATWRIRSLGHVPGPPWHLILAFPHGDRYGFGKIGIIDGRCGIRAQIDHVVAKLFDMGLEALLERKAGMVGAECNSHCRSPFADHCGPAARTSGGTPLS